ncbi:glycosyl hydrolase family 3 N terminal domain protein [Mycobacterium xenopi 4042]|uniref:Glycosyl hydrolase family 3 N terminal domain protein n=1 Tax=Mycobacterium xenopi 4042 TaxID=1299334 RepID=X8BIL3_MYCXE|nr:glycosyl hydrolase family 3 N terminal domain protein [Mycobacterium xenopi 4042]
MTDPDTRAREIEAKLTDDERFSLLASVMGANELLPVRDERIPADVPMSAGYVPGIPRLGVPPLLMTDASLGVTNPGYRPGDTATALPAGLALAASFNPALARASGAAVAREARSRGFNVLLAGGINLARDPRNGRNFEYLSEDPFLSATIAAESINGIQQQGVISTIKHYSLNCNETNRNWLDAVIDADAHRESDLLAFEIAIGRSQPGAVMTAYNKVNGDYASGNDLLLNDILKVAWGYQGWVMSDWGRRLAGSLRSRAWTRSQARKSTDCFGVQRHSPTASEPPMPKANCPNSAFPTWRVGSYVRYSPSAPIDGRLRRHQIWLPTMQLRWTSLDRESCCCKTAGCSPSNRSRRVASP